MCWKLVEHWLDFIIAQLLIILEDFFPFFFDQLGQFFLPSICLLLKNALRQLIGRIRVNGPISNYKTACFIEVYIVHCDIMHAQHSLRNCLLTWLNKLLERRFHIALCPFMELHKGHIIAIEPIFLFIHIAWRKSLRVFFFGLFSSAAFATFELVIKLIKIIFLLQSLFNVIFLHEFSEVFLCLPLFHSFLYFGFKFILSLEPIIPMLLAVLIEFHNLSDNLELCLNFFHYRHILYVWWVSFSKYFCFRTCLSDDSWHWFTIRALVAVEICIGQALCKFVAILSLEELTAAIEVILPVKQACIITVSHLLKRSSTSLFSSLLAISRSSLSLSCYSWGDNLISSGFSNFDSSWSISALRGFYICFWCSRLFAFGSYQSSWSGLKVWSIISALVFIWPGYVPPSMLFRLPFLNLTVSSY